MRNEIIKRVLEEANYILKTNKTIREIAYENAISKSTVHKDLHDRLKLIDINLYRKVNKILQEHIDIRHIKGGESTRQKYLKIKEILEI
ncbi:MAG: stage III sporulation protein D [Firmicutes bacterium]|nr:stage III sporulation protein D [Bacillota bacterium]